MYKFIGISMIVLGSLCIVYGGISYISTKKTVDIGLVELAVEERNTLLFPFIVGAITLGGGVLLFLANRSTDLHHS